MTGHHASDPSGRQTAGTDVTDEVSSHSDSDLVTRSARGPAAPCTPAPAAPPSVQSGA